MPTSDKYYENLYSEIPEVGGLCCFCSSESERNSSGTKFLDYPSQLTDELEGLWAVMFSRRIYTFLILLGRIRKMEFRGVDMIVC